MSETDPEQTPDKPFSAPIRELSASPAKEPKKESSFALFLVKLAIAVLLFRTLVFTSFSIPSESMMPTLLEGDYLFAAKWPYGYSRASLPLDVGLWEGRIPDGMPERGDVVIFKHPVDRTDYVKRVIGLPGDQIQVVGGVVHIDGQPVKLEKIEDFVLPMRPDEGCAVAGFTQRLDDGSFVCRYPQYRETLPNGVSHAVLDFGRRSQDDTAAIVVPEGQLFLMGDNRDNSLDSRFPALPGMGVGLVPIDNVAGRPSFLFFSTNGSAEWIKPWTWFTAARWNRIGRGL